MKRADVKVGFACNNICSFCVQGDKRSKYPPRSLDEIKKILEDEFSAGSRGVVFTGGEPTIHKGLIESVNYAKNLGYKQIQIQSNGRNFENLEYVKDLIKAGVTEFGPSIHGFKKETHDKLVGASGAWEQVVKGLINLKNLKQYVIINSVVTKDNYKEIPELASLLVKLGVNQFQFAFVHILGSADKNKDVVVPKKTDVMPYIKKALDIGKNAGVVCMTEAIPFCLMQGYEWAIAEYNFMPETTVVDAEYRTESYAYYRWNEGKSKREDCKKCKKYSVCEGPWKEYPLIYGWDEFQPI
ncbi:MAG: radical SAM protein [Candidatus Gracilibacteria bacterium]|nr:radical SAM protein [Candidatus Gracilibacteria bacterium]